MKKIILSTIILLVYCSTLPAQLSYLNKKIDINVNNTSVSAMLSQIETEADVSFTYNSMLILNKKRVTLAQNDITVLNVLNFVFNPNEYEFTEVGQNIIIKPKLIAPKETNLLLSGKIIDSHTKMPLPFAHISLNNNKIGCISNNSGVFSFQVPASFKSDTVTVSYLGYEKNKYIITKTDTNLSFQLQPLSYQINPVSVYGIEPIELLKNAQTQKLSNYTENKGYFKAFYTEMYYNDTVLTNKAEAFLEIYKGGLNNNLKSDQIKLIEGRKLSLKEQPKITLLLKGGPYNYLTLDVSKNSLDFLQKHNFKNYTYDLDGSTLLNNRESYVINFKPKKAVSGIAHSGTIYIDKESNAISKIQFSIQNQLNQKLSTEGYSVKDNSRFVVEYLKMVYEINYAYINGQWYFHDAGGEEIRKIVNKTTGRITYITSLAQLVMIEKLPNTSSGYKTGLMLRNDRIFMNQIKSYNPEFWKQVEQN